MAFKYSIWIKTFLVSACLLGILFFLFYFQPKVGATSNPVVSENQQVGSTNWEPDQAGLTFSDDVSKQIKGFASSTSVNKGNPIDLLITSNAPSYNIDLYRMGWYNGAGGRLMQHVGPLTGVIQPACPMDSSTGLLSCSNWSKSYTLNVPTTWTSGIYMAHLITSTNYHDYIIFVVRDDTRTADLLYQQSVTTYQAYNDYPNDLATGKSLYAFNSQGANTVGGDKRAVKVSFDRPYASGNSFSNRGHGEGEFFSWEIHMVRWLEKNGYDVSYSTNIDTHENGARLKSFKGFISTGHDEYYSKQMYDAVAGARDVGVNLAFFGANDIYNQIRLEPSTNGVADRTEVHYRSSAIDPVADKSLLTISWRSLNINPRPEEGLLGIQYSGHDTWNTTLPGEGDTVDYVVNNASNWAYANSGLTESVHVPRVVGYETDRDMSADTGGPAHPANLSYTLLSHSPYISQQHNNETDFANSVIYQAPSGAWVFTAGSISWSWGLDNWRFQSFANSGIQQMTANILNKFIGQPLVNPTPVPTSTPMVNSVTITPEADSYIDSTTPSSTAGGINSSLIASGNGVIFTQRPFLRFNLASAVGKTLVAAKLRLTTSIAANSGSVATQGIKFLFEDAWKEPYLSWNNTVAPTAIQNAPLLGSLTIPTQPNTFYDIPLDLTKVQSEVNASGAKISMVIDNTNTDNFIFNSREAATGQPQLILTFNNPVPSPTNNIVPTPSPSPTPSSSASPTPLPTPTQTPLPSPTSAPQYRIFNNVVPGYISTSPWEVELGVKFRATQPGKIIGVRFYKGAGNTGTHTGTLWSNAGIQLANATFTNETATGWQEVLFSTPVTINANTTYVASYHTFTGHFAQNAPSFSTAITNGPLTALQNGFDGPNGVYSAFGFPTSTYNASNYYVDVIFQ